MRFARRRAGASRREVSCCWPSHEKFWKIYLDGKFWSSLNCSSVRWEFDNRAGRAEYESHSKTWGNLLWSHEAFGFGIFSCFDAWEHSSSSFSRALECLDSSRNPETPVMRGWCYWGGCSLAPVTSWVDEWMASNQLIKSRFTSALKSIPMSSQNASQTSN